MRLKQDLSRKSIFQVIGLICCGQLFLQIYVFSLGIIPDQNHTVLAHYQALRKIPKIKNSKN